MWLCCDPSAHELCSPLPDTPWMPSFPDQCFASGEEKVDSVAVVAFIYCDLFVLPSQVAQLVVSPLFPHQGGKVRVSAPRVHCARAARAWAKSMIIDLCPQGSRLWLFTRSPGKRQGSAVPGKGCWRWEIKNKQNKLFDLSLVIRSLKGRLKRRANDAQGDKRVTA